MFICLYISHEIIFPLRLICFTGILHCLSSITVFIDCQNKILNIVDLVFYINDTYDYKNMNKNGIKRDMRMMASLNKIMYRTNKLAHSQFFYLFSVIIHCLIYLLYLSIICLSVCLSIKHLLQCF